MLQQDRESYLLSEELVRCGNYRLKENLNFSKEDMRGGRRGEGSVVSWVLFLIY